MSVAAETVSEMAAGLKVMASRKVGVVFFCFLFSFVGTATLVVNTFLLVLLVFLVLVILPLVVLLFLLLVPLVIALVLFVLLVLRFGSVVLLNVLGCRLT